MTFLLLLQDASNVVVSATQTTHPERRPALFSLIYIAGLAVVALILFLSLFRYHRRRANSGLAYDLSPEIRKRLGQLKVHDDVLEAFERTRKHLLENEVDLEKSKMSLGALLHLDSERERFLDNPTADAFLTREYRKPFVVPAANEV